MWKPCSFSWVPQRGKRASGFTLIEILLVLGIMAIVLAFGLPAMIRVLDREPLRQAVADVVEALSHARAHAILQGAPAEMLIDGDYRIRVRISPRPSQMPSARGPDPWTPGPEAATPPETGSLFEARFGEDIVVTSLRVNGGANVVLLPDVKDTRVRFYPNGTSEDFEMDLQDATGARRISLDPVTGFADVITTR